MNINNQNEKSQQPSTNMAPPMNNFFQGLAQMNFLQLKFSEDLKRHYLQSQGEISMLHKMVQAERVKSQVAEDNLKKLQTEKKIRMIFFGRLVNISEKPELPTKKKSPKMKF